jgi:hypothetical protein
MDADAIDPKIDGQRMPQVAQMREPYARQRVAFHRPSGREAGEIAVSEGENDHVAGRLAKVDRLDHVVERR